MPPRKKGNLAKDGYTEGQIDHGTEGLPVVVRGGQGRAGGKREVEVGRRDVRVEVLEDGSEVAIVAFGQRTPLPAYPEPTPEIWAAAPDRFASSKGELVVPLTVEMGQSIMRLCQSLSITSVSRSIGAHPTWLGNELQKVQTGKTSEATRPYWVWLFRGIAIAKARRAILMEGVVERAAEGGDWKAADRILGVEDPESWAPPKQVQIEHTRSVADDGASRLNQMLQDGTLTLEQLMELAGHGQVPEAIEVKDAAPPQLG